MNLGLGAFCLEQPCVREHKQLEGVLDDVRVFDVDHGKVVQFIQSVELVANGTSPAAHFNTELYHGCILLSETEASLPQDCTWWNSLLATLRQMISHRQFIKHPKTHLFRAYRNRSAL